MSRVLSYEEKDTWIHRLSGVTKLLFFLLWSITSMISYDTRVLLVMLVCSLIIFAMSKTKWKQVGTVFKFIMFFLVINLIAIFFFSPGQGTKIYGTETPIVHLFGHYTLTKEQLFYEFNVMVKYLTVIPAVFMFIVATNPSELAASLNRVGVSYKIGYSVAIALRYIPDVQDDFAKIKHAQEARGIEMSGKAKLGDRGGDHFPAGILQHGSHRRGQQCDGAPWVRKAQEAHLVYGKAVGGGRLCGADCDGGIFRGGTDDYLQQRKPFLQSVCVIKMEESGFRIRWNKWKH